MTVFNHEVWRICQTCGHFYDLRLSTICNHCKHDNNGNSNRF